MSKKLLGLIDLLAGISIILLFFGASPGFAIFVAILLIIKSLAFIGAFASWIDLVSSVIIILSAVYGTSIFLWIVFLWLMQKFIFTMFFE